jgi:hypothetical protein
LYGDSIASATTCGGGLALAPETGGFATALAAGACVGSLSALAGDYDEIDHDIDKIGDAIDSVF